jgi:hypothetical protein
MACQKPEKFKKLRSYFNNEGLDEWASRAEKGEAIWLASIFGGTSIA